MLLAGFAFTAPAHAITLHAPESYEAQHLLQQWADEAAREVPMPPVSTRVRLQPCSKPESSGACVHIGRWGQIIDFPRAFLDLVGTDQIVANMTLSVRFAFLHELGHVADLRPHNRRPWRAAFRGVFGLRAALPAQPAIGFRGLDPWLLAYTPADEVARPMEWFADAYAACAIWPHETPPTGLSMSIYDYAPTPDQHARACRIVRAMPPD